MKVAKLSLLILLSLTINSSTEAMLRHVPKLLSRSLAQAKNYNSNKFIQRDFISNSYNKSKEEEWNQHKLNLKFGLAIGGTALAIALIDEYFQEDDNNRIYAKEAENIIVGKLLRDLLKKIDEVEKKFHTTPTQVIEVKNQVNECLKKENCSFDDLLNIKSYIEEKINFLNKLGLNRLGSDITEDISDALNELNLEIKKYIKKIIKLRRS